jgi:hypothetical protein
MVSWVWLFLPNDEVVRLVHSRGAGEWQFELTSHGSIANRVKNDFGFTSIHSGHLAEAVRPCRSARDWQVGAIVEALRLCQFAHP